MLSLKITDIKKITSMLFVSDTFDRFFLRDASFETAINAVFSGQQNPDFYEENEREALKDNPYVRWEAVRPVFFQLIKGKRLPLSFKAVLLTDKAQTDKIREKCGFDECPVTSLSMNFLYHDNELFLTTGVAYGGFTLDKTMEKAWDETVLRFLELKECSFEEV